MDKLKFKIGDFVVTHSPHNQSNLWFGIVYGVKKSRIQVRVNFSFGTLDYPKQYPDVWHKITPKDELLLKSKVEAINKAERELKDTLNNYPTG